MIPKKKIKTKIKKLQQLKIIMMRVLAHIRMNNLTKSKKRVLQKIIHMNQTHLKILVQVVVEVNKFFKIGVSKIKMIIKYKQKLQKKKIKIFMMPI